MIDDFTLRTAAVVAAIALAAGPTVVDAVRQVFWKARSAVSKGWRQQQEADLTQDDAHTVVEISRRLRKSGNTKGADLCKQLLDVMLSSELKS